MNHFKLINLLLALLLASASFASYATGASSAQIYIEPITYNERGDILFKAFKQIDYTGAASGQKHSYWWIVVSNRNQWAETLHVSIVQPESSTSDKPDAKYDQAFKRYQNKTDFYANEFEKGFDWSNPPKSLRPLIKKYGFKSRPGFDKNEGQGTVTWSSKGICVNDKCSKLPISQRTLGNKTSSEAYTEIDHTDKEIARKDNKIVWVEVPPVPCIFYHAGVALFKNGNYEIVDKESGVSNTKQRGADFDFNRNQNAVEKIENINGEVIHSYDGDVIDEYYIDAIGIVPSELISK